MTRSCYFHDTPLIEASGHAACLTCGTLYPILPAVPTKPDAAQLPGGRGVNSSRLASAGTFYTHPRDWQVSADAGRALSLPGRTRGPASTQEMHNDQV